MALPKVGIIILHYGRWELTQKCIEAVAKLDTHGFTSIVVVVNNSLEVTTTQQLRRLPQVTRVIVPSHNLGFSQGNNVGLEYCFGVGCSYGLLLNNDALIGHRCVHYLLKTAQTALKPLLLGAIIEHRVGDKTYYDYGGWIDWPKGQPKHINHTQAPTSPSRPLIRDFVSGCCLWIPQAIYHHIGGLTASYFMYLEDVEYCLRAHRFGYQTAVVTSAHVFHYGSQSVTQWQKIGYSLRNSLKLIWTYVPWPYKLSAWIFSLGFYPGLWIRWQVRRLKSSK